MEDGRDVTEHCSRSRARQLGRATVVVLLLASGVLLPTLALAHSAHRAGGVVGGGHRHVAHTHAAVAEAEDEYCKITIDPGSFIDTGEHSETGEHSSSVITIVEVECLEVYKFKKVRIAANELWARCAKHLSWEIPPEEPEPGLREGREVEAELDEDGTATVVAFGGPSCAEGASLITADLEAGFNPTIAAEFVVLPPLPATGRPSITVYPEGGAIETATSFSVAGLVVIKFPPVFAGQFVSITNRQLFESCEGEVRHAGAPPTKLLWVGLDEEIIGENVEPNTERVQLDNDGNAAIVMNGVDFCEPNMTLVEASLEEPPFTTITAHFKVFLPRPTFEGV